MSNDPVERRRIADDAAQMLLHAPDAVQSKILNNRAWWSLWVEESPSVALDLYGKDLSNRLSQDTLVSVVGIGNALYRLGRSEDAERCWLLVTGHSQDGSALSHDSRKHVANAAINLCVLNRDRRQISAAKQYGLMAITLNPESDSIAEIYGQVRLMT